MPKARANRSVESELLHEAQARAVMTAYTVHGDQEKALAAGFTRHISKPVNLSNLRQIVAELLA